IESDGSVRPPQLAASDSYQDVPDRTPTNANRGAAAMPASAETTEVKASRPGSSSPPRVLASSPPSGADWVHEIKHDGYRLIVRRDGPVVRLYSRNAIDLTARLSAIAVAAERIKAKCFTIDGEAVVLGPDGLSRFEDLRRRSAARTAILYAFDLIERDGEDCAIVRYSTARPSCRCCCAMPLRPSCSTSTSPRMAPPCSRMLAGLAPRASSRRRSTALIGQGLARYGSRSAILPASRCSGSGA